jgi:hypothetical protein
MPALVFARRLKQLSREEKTHMGSRRHVIFVAAGLPALARAALVPPLKRRRIN